MDQRCRAGEGTQENEQQLLGGAQVELSKASEFLWHIIRIHDLQAGKLRADTGLLQCCRGLVPADSRVLEGLQSGGVPYEDPDVGPSPAELSTQCLRAA
ncbi:hypothetical protein NFC73_06465 [Pseudarthrobacter sp. RMG13]|uniref:Uncharacterized protein n=1 Tax=Pseudarthrobacter humi TaxID=2952523 RepID=A0ABT1LNT9_9MICC|nr:hypothetical protein [Pseudarthrobacter humi]MCP8999383.1 hypothetical protein [Pseudarthrobacter humi]